MGVSAVDAKKNTALHLAVRRRLTDVCQAILARKGFTKVNARDANDKTLLHLAAAGGLTEVCQAILQRHDFVAVGAHDRRGRAASEHAENHGHWDLARILREQESRRSGKVSN